jgi:hypothetical protein
MSKELQTFVLEYFRPKTGYTLRRQVAYWPYDEKLYKLQEQVTRLEDRSIIEFMQKNEMQIFQMIEMKETNQAENMEMKIIKEILDERR